MQTSAFEYKCRRCGEVWEDSWGDSLDVHERFAVICNHIQYPHPHHCANGGMGISDLIGITPPREEGE